MMSLKSKRELLEAARPKYLKAGKDEKQKTLDEFTSVTEYHRKHAIRVLKNKAQVQNHLKGKTKPIKNLTIGLQICKPMLRWMRESPIVNRKRKG